MHFKVEQFDYFKNVFRSLDAPSLPYFNAQHYEKKNIPSYGLHEGPGGPKIILTAKMITKNYFS